MSIHVNCPNGHALKVKPEYAGRTGICPKCGAKVYVPEPKPVAISDDDVLDLLGPAPQREAREPFGDSGFISGASGIHGQGAGGAEGAARPKRTCPKCERSVSASFHFCPYCRCYFGDASAKEKAAELYCPRCGSEQLPGDSNCSACGAALR